jgi:hypothetical protein
MIKPCACPQIRPAVLHLHVKPSSPVGCNDGPCRSVISGKGTRNHSQSESKCFSSSASFKASEFTLAVWPRTATQNCDLWVAPQPCHHHGNAVRCL